MNDKEGIIEKANLSFALIIPQSILLIFSYALSEYDFWLFVMIIVIIDIIWTCIKIKHTELCFTNEKIIGKTGVISTQSLDAPLSKINDIMIKKSLLGRILNYSTVVISTSSSKYHYEYVKDADEFKNKLTKQIELLDSKKDTTVIEEDKFDKLKKLKELLDTEAITQEEYEKEKEKLLK